MSLPNRQENDMNTKSDVTNPIRVITGWNDTRHMAADAAMPVLNSSLANTPVYMLDHVPDRDIPNLRGPSSKLNSQDTFLMRYQHAVQYAGNDGFQICSACGKKGCSLRTHQAYTRRNLALPPLESYGNTQVRGRGTQSRKLPLEQDTDLRISWQIENPRIDPFAKFPIPILPEDHRLLDLWTQQWPGTHQAPSRHLFPVPTINMLYPYIMRSPTLFRAFLSVAATQISMAKGEIDEVSFRQQAAAVQLHSAACMDDKTASSDDNILAALCIMSNHMAQGNVSEAHHHTEGINALVRSRGGPHYLGMNGIVAGYLMYADHAQAIWHNRQPVWKVPLPSLKFPGIPSHPKLGSGFQMLHGHLDPSFLELADDMSRLTGLFEAGFKGKIPRKALQPIGYLSMVCEYQMAELAFQHGGPTSRTLCLCLALLLFDHVVLRNVGAINPGIRRNEQRFWHNLRESQNLKLWVDDVYARLLLWTLLTGLSVTIRAKSPWYDYAIEEIRIVRARIGLQSFDEVKQQVLDPFCWLDVAQEPTFRRIWQKVEQSNSNRSAT